MSLPDEAMKLKDGKIIYDQLASMIAVQYSEAESNPAGSYVIYNGSVYLLPNGHTANTSWANTEKEGPTNIGEKLSSQLTEISSKYDIFNDYSEPSNNVPDLTEYDDHSTVKIIGTEMSFGNAKLYNQKNIIAGKDNISTLYGLTFTQHGASMLFNGTKSAESSIKYPNLTTEDVEIDAGTTLNVYVESNSPFIALTNDLYISFVATDNTVKDIYIIPSSSTTSVSRSFTADKDIKQIKVNAEIPKAESVIDSLRMWIGIFTSSVSSVDTNLEVDEGEEEIYTNASLNNWDALDFGKYNGSVSFPVEDLKGYIDSVSPDIKMTYTAPEDFGAGGKGQTDDYRAMQDCIDYAIANNVPVRAYGSYVITQPIVIDGDRTNIEINEILPSMNDYAVKLSGRSNILKIKRIYNNTGGGGVLLNPITTDYMEMNTIEVDNVWVNNGDAIHMSCSSDGTQSLIYNIVKVTSLFSRNGNCIYCENGFGENKFYGGKLATTAGWGIYLKNHSFGKFYGFSMEGDCYAGIRLDNSGRNEFIGFRNIELIIKKTDATDKGTLLKLSGIQCVANYYGTTDTIYGEAIDISGLIKIKDWNDWESIRARFASIIETSAEIESAIVHTYSGGITLNATSANSHKGIIKNERIICVPTYASVKNLDDDIDLSVIPYEGQYSSFILKNDLSIKLNPSYSSAGMNEFFVNNPSGHSFSVEDCNGILFVQAMNAGAYRFYCFADVDNVYKGSYYEQSGIPGWWNGENDVWYVEHNGNTIACIHLQPFYKSVNDTVTVTGELVSSGTWDTSDSSVATVNNGTITAVGTGKAVISVTGNGDTVERWVIDVE